MRIAFVFGSAYGVGGHFASAGAFAVELIERGHDVVYVIDAAAPDGAPPPTVKVRSLAVVRSPRYPFNLQGVSKLIDFLKEERVDVIACQNAQGVPICAFASWRTRIPMVRIKAGGPKQDYFLPRGVRYVDYSSESLDAALERQPYLKGWSHVVAARIPFSAPSEGNVSRENLLARYGIPDEGGRIFLTAMRLHPGKGVWLETILAAIERVLDKSGCFDDLFLFAGGGDFRDSMQERVSRLNERIGKKRVFLLGEIADRSEMARLFARADVMVGHGRGILEGAPYAKPLVVVGDGCSELVAEDRIDAIGYRNFSGRHFSPDCDRNDLVAILSGEIELDADQAAKICSVIRTRYDVKTGAKEFESVYRTAAADPPMSAIRLLGWYLRWIAWKVRRSFARVFTR